MPQLFQPPANLKDFDRSTQEQSLRQNWHRIIGSIVTSPLADGPTPAFSDPLSPPDGVVPATAAPEWTGLPRTITRLVPASLTAAAQLVDDAIPMGNPDPMVPGRFTATFADARTGTIFPGPAYRPQDEY